MRNHDISIRLWLPALLLVVWPLTAAAGQGGVVLQADSCLEGLSPRGCIYPIQVTLQNRGASVDGALVARCLSYSGVLRTYNYPVSLPAGTQKQITTYPAVATDTAEVRLSFDGPARSQDTTVRIEDRAGLQVGLIGDEVGALGFLRAASGPRPPEGSTVNDCYARPEGAPDRAVGYQALDTLVVTDGAERLRPEQWNAIRQWTLGGGSLILVGGAGAAYLRAPEAAPLLPLTNLHPATATDTLMIYGPPVLNADASVQPIWPDAKAAIWTGSLRSGAIALMTCPAGPAVARRPFGAGVVLFVAYNPSDKPIRDRPDRQDLWHNLLHEAAAPVPAAGLRSWTEQQATAMEDDEENSGGSSSAQAHVDPFRITLPPLSVVGWMFVAYFVLVVPVTYWALKRAGRLEWAWVTSPLLSIAFAYGFYLFTAQLTKAGLSRRTAGVLVAAAGDTQARFDGFSELFFPRGGRYEIAVPAAEALELAPFSSNDEEGAREVPLETSDSGQVTVPGLELGNLSFRRIYHTEPVTLAGPISCNLRVDGAGRITGSIHNGSGLPLTTCRLSQPGAHLYAVLSDLAPGQTTLVRPGDTMPLRGSSTSVVPTVPETEFSRHARTAYFYAQTAGSSYGPPVGRDVGGPGSVTVLVSMPLEGTGPTP